MNNLKIFSSMEEFEAAKPSMDTPFVVLEKGTSKVIYSNLLEITEEELPKVEAVDLGLPSGLKWASCNVGAENETDPGLYYMWADTEGHEKNSGYIFSEENYNSKGLNAISTDLNLAQDAANVRLGGSWRMPTKTEFEELYNNTNVTWTTINGVAGRKFTNKTDASKYIFMPAAGFYNGSSLYDWGSGGSYWSCTLKNSSHAYGFNFNSGNQGTDDSGRYYGFSVRAVCK